MKETCYCGLNEVEIEHASHCVMGEVCCTPRCYQEAMQSMQPLERDGFHWSNRHGHEPLE